MQTSSGWSSGTIVDDHTLRDVTQSAGIVGATGNRDMDRLAVWHAGTLAIPSSPIKTIACRKRAERPTRPRHPSWDYDPAMSEGVEAKLRAFIAERDWGQFHSPENLAKSIAIEAGELLECFQWSDAANRDQVIEELADVLTYCHLLAQNLAVDTDEIVLQKLEKTREKYPPEKARGRSTRYEQL